MRPVGAPFGTRKRSRKGRRKAGREGESGRREGRGEGGSPWRQEFYLLSHFHGSSQAGGTECFTGAKVTQAEDMLKHLENVNTELFKGLGGCLVHHEPRVIPSRLRDQVLSPPTLYESQKPGSRGPHPRAASPCFPVSLQQTQRGPPSLLPPTPSLLTNLANRRQNS